MKHTFILLLAIAASVTWVQPAMPAQPVAPARPVVPARPAAWAVPITLDGVPNLQRVSPALYRSTQPTAQGMKNLATIGIRTVVSLRTFHSDRTKLEGTGIGYERIAMKAWHAEEEDAVRFLKIVTDTARAPVLVYCKRGADRTGAMCALYRIAVQGWTKEEAIEEMTKGGYGFYAIWSNLKRWIIKLDIDDLKRKAGIGGGTAAAADSAK